MTTLTIAYRAVHNKIKSVDIPIINWKLVYILGILVCFSSLVFYVFYVNQLIGGTYLIRNYNKEIGSLLKKNKVMEADFVESDFLSQIHNKAKEIGFEKPSQIKYVEIVDTSLAKAP